MKTSTVLKYGLIAGLFIASAMLLSISYLDHGNMSYGLAEILGYLSMLVGFSAVYIGVRRHRDLKLGGEITFGKAFVLGLQMVLIASIIYVVGWLMYITINGNEFMAQYFDAQIAEVVANGKPEAENAKEIANLEEKKEFYSKPMIQGVVAFTEIFPPGLLISLITGLLVKRKN